MGAGSDRQLVEAIQQLAGNQLSDEVTMLVAEVTAVDLDECSCTCNSLSTKAPGTLNGVRLLPVVDDGLLYVPSIGSNVIILMSKYNTPCIVMYSQLDRIVLDTGNSSVEFTENLIKFNAGENGGLTNTPELRDQLNKTNDLLTAILDVINGVPILEPGNNSPSALQTALQAAITGKAIGTYENIEDETITH